MSSLAEGRATVLTFSWNTGSSSLGAHTLRATHNLDNDEVNNNTGSINITINEPIFLDIAITNVEASPSSKVVQGDNVIIKVTLQNLGNRDVNEAITVRFIKQIDGMEIGIQTLSGGLVKGGTETLSINWDTDGLPIGNYTIVARHNFGDDNSANDSRSIVIIVE